MKIKKFFATVMGAALALTVAVATPVKAAEKEYKGAELVAVPAETFNMGAIVFETEGDAVNVTVPSQWNQAVFEIPAEVLAAGLESATFNMEGGSCTLKFIGQRADGALIGIIADYSTPGSLIVTESNIDPWGGDPKASVDEFGLIKYIDIMNGNTDELKIKLNSVVFTTTNEIASAPVEEAPAEEAPAEEAPAEDVTAPAPELPKTGLVSGAAFLAVGAAMMLGGAAVAKKKED